LIDHSVDPIGRERALEIARSIGGVVNRIDDHVTIQ